MVRSALRSDLERRGYTVDEVTRSMGMGLDDIRFVRLEIELGAADWSEHLRLAGMPDGFLSGMDPRAFHVLVARLGCENVSTAIALDVAGDCGIYNVGTLEHARRRGLATALTTIHLHDARARGCRTASLQSTATAERVYTAVGFRDLGRIIEYVPSSIPGGALGPRGSDQDDVSGVDAQVISRSGLREPSKLHDRTPSRVQHDPFDVLDVAVDEIPVSGRDDYLRRGGLGQRLALARAHQLGSRVRTGCALGGARHSAPQSQPSVEKAIAPSGRPKDPHCDACRGATVTVASSVAAREVLLADAANLLPKIFRAGQGRSHMPRSWQSGEVTR